MRLDDFNLSSIKTAIYVGKHVKITRQWKYTLVDNNLSSQIVLLYIIYIILSALKDVKNLT